MIMTETRNKMISWQKTYLAIWLHLVLELVSQFVCSGLDMNTVDIKHC